MSTVQERVLKIVAEQLGIHNTGVTLESSKDSLGMDSLDDIELVMALEDEFEIAVSDDDAEKWVTAQDVVSYFAERAK